MIHGDIFIDSPANLSIHPGVILKFSDGRDLWINGSLNATGTKSNPIIFTSIKDDSIGGDSNGDGTSVGTPGDWGGVRFRDTSDDNICVMDKINDKQEKPLNKYPDTITHQEIVISKYNQKSTNYNVNNV